MRNIYISDTGKDEQDGLTSKTPIRSWARYLKIKSGNDNLVLMGNPEASFKGSTRKSRNVSSNLNVSCAPLFFILGGQVSEVAP